MEKLQNFLTKEEIQRRFIEAVQTLLSQDKTLTKTSLAESLNVKLAKFSEILNGRMKAGVDTIAMLCDFWNVSPDWLLLNRGSIFRDELQERPAPEHEAFCGYRDSEGGQSGTDQNVPAAEDISLLISRFIDTIRIQAEDIGQLKARISELERHRGGSAGNAPNSGTADVG